MVLALKSGHWSFERWFAQTCTLRRQECRCREWRSVGPKTKAIREAWSFSLIWFFWCLLPDPPWSMQENSLLGNGQHRTSPGTTGQRSLGRYLVWPMKESCGVQSEVKSIQPLDLAPLLRRLRADNGQLLPYRLGKGCRQTRSWQLEHARGTISRLTFSMRELGHKPRPGHLPIAHDALWGNPQHFCRLLHAEAPEKSEFDDLGFAGVDLSQGIQGFVDGDNLAVPGARGDFRYVVQIRLNRTAAPFGHAL